MRPDSDDVQAAMKIFLSNALQSGDALPPSFLLSCGQTLRRLLPEVAFQGVSRYHDVWENHNPNLEGKWVL